MAHLSLALLGPFQATGDEKPVPLITNRLFALLGRIAARCRTQESVGRGGFQGRAFYRVYSYMAEIIDQELGRETLVRTISKGLHAFVHTHNAAADGDMRIRVTEQPWSQVGSIDRR